MRANAKSRNDWHILKGTVPSFRLALERELHHRAMFKEDFSAYKAVEPREPVSLVRSRPNAWS
jgi:hypothetical protein